MIFILLCVKIQLMKFTELKNDIADGAKNIYLLEGDDAYFLLKGEQMIKSAFLENAELNFSAFDGETLKGGAITSLTSALESFPFMAPKRIVKVTDFYPTESEYDKFLKNTFENFPPTSILIIVNHGGKKSDLKRKGCITYVDCNRADEETVAKWAYLTFKRAGITCPVDACTAIARYCLCNMSRVALEVEKLIDYKGSGALTREEVEDFVYKDADYRIYEMTNAIARRDYDKYLSIQSDLCRKNGDETSLMSGLFSYFKNLLTIAESRGSDAELARILKMKEYGVKKSREQAYSIGAEKLKAYVTAVYSALADIKGGITTPQSGLMKINATIFFG
ncbi:MAG TPA: DNA polymerase III subunit delta [Clostridiales bacterium]|nr:DNA polymerase III subunit delta [Clostridiales bacterium]